MLSLPIPDLSSLHIKQQHWKVSHKQDSRESSKGQSIAAVGLNGLTNPNAERFFSPFNMTNAASALARYVSAMYVYVIFPATIDPNAMRNSPRKS